MNTGKKIAGFILILSVILVVLQLMSMFAKKDKVAVGPGAQFMPEPVSEKDKPPEETIQQPDPETTKNAASKAETSPESEPPESESVEPEPVEAEKAGSPPHSIPEIPSISQDEKLGHLEAESSAKLLPVMPSKEKVAPKPDVKKGTKILDVISLSNEEFVAIDNVRNKIKKHAESFQKEMDGLYGWGLVGEYKNPDMAVRTLGGIPFAIDEAGQRYYRISLSERQVRLTMIKSAYSATGIEAHDPKLSDLVKRAVQEEQVLVSPNSLSYYYLFSTNTERYIMGKVIRAFEWFINKSGFDGEKADEFRKNARLRLGVWQATRFGGGEMGIAIPIYFDYNDQKLFLPQEYYQNDSEAVRLKLKIDQNMY